MSAPDRWPEADALIDDLLTLPLAERRRALDARTGLDPALRAMVEMVLAEADAADPFLDPAAIQRRPLVDDLVERLAADRGDTLQAGVRFGPYDVIALVGRGGMGEVYRAHDSRLGRDVALKTLPLDFEDDPERAARFDREARVLASLNHPNIAAIYGIVDDSAGRALVLEFIEGETLSEIIKRGRVPLAQALAWTRQVALAIQAAHDRGIVHRDLKPSNIRVTNDGIAKVLDFGLAKALGPAAPVHADDKSLTAMWKPDGAVLGTPAYMAPEQALGERASAGTDAWALGCVLYELIAGIRPFVADTNDKVRRHILEDEPDLTRVRPGTPDWVCALVRGLLRKDPRQRLSIAAVLDEMDRHHGGRRATSGADSVRRVAVAVLVFGSLSAAGFLAVTRGRRDPVPVTPVRLAVPVPASDTLLLSGQPVAAISPDGKTIVYRAVRHGRVFLFARTLDAVESRPIPGTENGAAPFFSPDGAWVGFDGDGVLRKVRLDGGPPIALTEAHGGATGSWAGDVILFATPTGRVLQKVSAAGGRSETMTALDQARGDVAHSYPHLLPDADAALFTVATASARHVALVDLASREVRILTEGAQPRLLGDQLLFVRSDSLWAAPFDLRRRELRGEPRPVLNRLDIAGTGVAHFAVSSDGTLIYVPRREEVRDRRLVWVDRQGKETLLPLEPRRYQRAALSPDGRRVALALTEEENTDIWLADVNGETLMRLSKEPTTETAPLWTPDGRAIVFRSDREGGGLFVVPIDRPADVRRLTTSGPFMHTAHGWAPDARTLLFTEFRSYTEQLFAAVSLAGEPPRPLLGGSFAQLRPQVSLDGRWIAYQSDESGRFEIYVRPYPSLSGPPMKVSVDGGTSPRWAQDGRELFYYDGRSVWSTPVSPEGMSARTEPPTRLFDYAPYGGRLGPDFEVSPDGSRFLMIRPAEDTPASRAQLVLVQHWEQELRTPPAR